VKILIFCVHIIDIIPLRVDEDKAKAVQRVFELREQHREMYSKSINHRECL